jgi:hypothetical protein
MKRKYWLVAVGGLSLLYFAWLLHFSQVRGVDPDEGFYPTAARLAWEGKIPYRDFMLSQGVLIPYSYGWIWAIHARSLVSMRILSVVLGSLTVFLWGAFLFSLKRMKAGVALATFLIILMNPYWIALHSMVKTFAVADFLLTVTMICLYFGVESGRPKWYLAAGAALGLCASSRALYGPVLVVVAAWIAFVEWGEGRRPFGKTIAYLAGAGCGVLPMILSFAADPAAFLFNNFQYRRILDSYLTASFRQSLHMHLLDVYYIVQRRFFAAELVLAALGIISFLELRRRKDRPHNHQDYQFLLLAFLMMAAYTAAALIPLPTFAQYLDGPLLPFLALFIAEGVRVSFQASWKWAPVFAMVLPLFAWRGIGPEVGEFSSLPRLQLASYRRVADIVRANSAENATVLSTWPGYVFESGRRCFAGAENEFVYQVAERVDPRIRQRFHLVSKYEMLDALSKGVPDIFIPAALGRYMGMSEGEYRAMHESLDAHYSLVNTVDDVEIFRKRQ